MSQYSNSNLRSKLGRVRGLGSAKSGTHHWWMERLSALALIPLSIWFIIALITKLLGASPTDLQLWIASPVTALLLAVFSAIMFLHAKMGVQVIIEDYVHDEGKKIALLLFKDIVIYALLAGTLAAIAKLHFVGI
jgi:succinate dehydrogenase / fumarate reductase membrane anchor subunit